LERLVILFVTMLLFGELGVPSDNHRGCRFRNNLPRHGLGHTHPGMSCFLPPDAIFTFNVGHGLSGHVFEPVLANVFPDSPNIL
jgi:hypothetical protein